MNKKFLHIAACMGGLLFWSCKNEQMKNGETKTSMDSTATAGINKTSFDIDGFSISIGNANGKSVLVYEKDGKESTLKTMVPYPAKLHTDSLGKIRKVVYQDTTYFLIEQSVPDSISKANCITQVQGLKVSGSELKLSKLQEMDGTCLPYIHWDEFIFYSLF